MRDYFPMCQCLPKNATVPDKEGVIYCQETFASPMNQYSDGAPHYVCESSGKKRSLQDSMYNDDDDYDPYAYEIPDDDDLFNPANITWPTPSGITEDDAKQKCTDAVFKSNIAAACQEVDDSRVATDAAVEDCMFDILVSMQRFI